MWIINILKRNFIIPDLLSWVWVHIPFMLEHNLGKYNAIKKAFYLTGLEQLEGDYLEFGVFTGSSFICALRSHRALGYLGKVETKFYGFDSFSGFGTVSPHDEHPFYKDSTFSVDCNRVIKHINSKASPYKTHFEVGLFEKTLQNKTVKDLGVTKARIVMIDCDMKEPAQLALEFVKHSLQIGTILIMDDFYSYRGSNSKGVAGAFNDFCDKNKNLYWRRVSDYGYGGVVYVISDISSK